MRDSNLTYGELLDEYQQLRAEHHNYRERAERDKTQSFRSGTEHVYNSLIPVLDGLTAAELHGDLKDVPEGVQSLLAGLMSALHTNGLSMFGEKGDTFDPELHDAVQVRHEPGVETATIDEVIQCGYSTGFRVLRPAKVVVVAEPPRSQHSK